MNLALRRYGIQAALVGVAIVWGSTFVMVKDAVASYPLFSFLGWRFTVAVIAFVIIFPRAVRGLRRDTMGAGLLAGALLTAGYVFQTWGLQSTTASKAAFITGMFVVITPLMQTIVLRKTPRRATVVGIVASVIGLWLLSGGATGGWNVGDTRVLLCAIAYSAHMIVLGSVGERHDVLALTLIQLATTAIVCSVIAVVREGFSVPSEQSVIVALLVTGVLASAVAFAVQTYAQRFIPPARTALILISEPAFGGLFGWLAGDVLGARGLAGAGLILGGMAVSELAGARAPAEEGIALEPSLEGMPVPVIDADNEAGRTAAAGSE